MTTGSGVVSRDVRRLGAEAYALEERKGVYS
jgi:hypothetical protein